MFRRSDEKRLPATVLRRYVEKIPVKMPMEDFLGLPVSSAYSSATEVT